ncbi:MAG: LytR C-terminal domain-containing protein [Planctomycetaceae bacterium]
MNQGTARIVIIVAMVVVGAAVLMNGFGSSGSSVVSSSSSTSTSSTSTAPPSGSATSPTASPTPPPQKPKLVSIMALNGTSVTGLAAAAESTLTDAGYQVGAPAGNAPSTGVQKTVVYYRTGSDEAQNKSNATRIATKYFSGAKVEKLGSEFDSLVPSNVTVVVVAGQDFANVIAAGG